MSSTWLLNPCAPCCTTPSGGCNPLIEIRVFDSCTQLLASGVNIRAYMSGQPITSGTTNLGGFIDLRLPASGYWNIEGHRTNYTPKSGEVAVICSGTDVLLGGPGYTHYNFNLSRTTFKADRSIIVNGCVNNMSGVFVEGISSGITYATNFTNPSGYYKFEGIPSGVNIFRATYPRYAANSGTTVVTCGTVANATVTLTPSVGFFCSCRCQDPYPSSVYLNDPVLGMYRLDHNGGGANTTWSARTSTVLNNVAHRTFPSTCTIFASTGVYVDYELGCSAGKLTLTVGLATAICNPDRPVSSGMTGTIGNLPGGPAFFMSGQCLPTYTDIVFTGGGDQYTFQQLYGSGVIRNFTLSE